MDLFTHAILGALIYGTLGGNVSSEYFLLAIIFAILPDFDILLTPLRKIVKSDYLEHRGGSHSFIIGALVALFGSVIFSIVFAKSFLLAWLIGSLFYALHLSMDLLTTTLIPIIYPLSKKEYSFYIEKAGSFFTMIVSIGMLGLGIFFYQLQTPIIYRLFNGISLCFYLGYYSYRLHLRCAILPTLSQSQSYFPGVFPTQYFLYDYLIIVDKIQINLKKGNRKNHQIDLLEQEWILSSQEMNIYHYATQLCNEDYYRNKWTKIPFFDRNGGTLQITFFFLETMMNARSMALSYNFDIEKGTLLDASQNYGRIYSKEPDDKTKSKKR